MFRGFYVRVRGLSFRGLRVQGLGFKVQGFRVGALGILAYILFPFPSLVPSLHNFILYPYIPTYKKLASRTGGSRRLRGCRFIWSRASRFRSGVQVGGINCCSNLD